MKTLIHKLKYFGIVTLTFVCMFCMISQFVPCSNTYAATKKKAYAKCDDLNLRKKNTSSSKILKKFNKGDSFYVTGSKGDWYKVTSGSKKGYVHKKYVTYKKPSTKKKTSSSKSSSSKVTGAKVIAYAKKFVGNPYRYGGSSLTRGTDCSGFVRGVYRHFGVDMPHSSYGIRRVGRAVKYSEIQPGDIICYSGHVGIYAGNGKIVNALNENKGIVISDAKYKNIITIRRIF
jgi:cell wall-associated NlpC family hydrolase